MSKYHYSEFTETFFDCIERQDQAYLLGFWDGDGYVSTKRNRVGIQLSQKDINHLKKIKTLLKAENPIYLKPGARYEGSVGNSCELTLNSKKLKEGLIKQGCIPKKTLILEPPKNVPNELIRHVIRGYFDADGSIHSYYRDDRKNPVFGFSILGTENFLKFIIKNLPISMPIKRHTSGNVFTIKTQAKKKIKIMYEYLYKDSFIHLDRKKKIFEDLNTNY